MSVVVVSQTQSLEVSLAPTRIIFEPTDSTVTVIEATSSVSVINSGPPGPAGPAGVDGSVDYSEVDSRIAAHNQASPVHAMATSGRDFVALFQNGLI